MSRLLRKSKVAVAGIAVAVLATLFAGPIPVAHASGSGEIHAEVAYWYTTGLGRQPDAAGWNYWSATIRQDCVSNFSIVAATFLNSDEYWNSNGTNQQRVENLYWTILHRAGDPAGVSYWKGILDAYGRSQFGAVIWAVAASAEAFDDWHSGPCRNYQMDTMDVIHFTWAYGTFKGQAGPESPDPNNPGAPGQQTWPWADWSNDECSAPLAGNSPFDFKWACRRHDFGYRNLIRVDNQLGNNGFDIWTGANRSMVDTVFRDDMGLRCGEHSWWEQPGCESFRLAYYFAVKNGPGLPGYNYPSLPPYIY